MDALQLAARHRQIARLLGAAGQDHRIVVALQAVGGEIEAGNRPSAMCQTDATKTVYWDWVNSNGFGGTSFSAPEVAGLAALVRDYFQQGFYPTGTATPANAMTPAGSLIKAVILASGEDLLTAASPSSSITLTKRYGSDTGYGRANLPAVLHIGSAAPFLWVQNNDTLGDGATKTFFYNITGNATPLRVMMTYYDAAGNALQKDADLRVTIGANGGVGVVGLPSVGGQLTAGQYFSKSNSGLLSASWHFAHCWFSAVAFESFIDSRNWPRTGPQPNATLLDRVPMLQLGGPDARISAIAGYGYETAVNVTPWPASSAQITECTFSTSSTVK
jgi:hypothetical protein